MYPFSKLSHRREVHLLKKSMGAKKIKIKVKGDKNSNVSYGDSNPGLLDPESDVLPLELPPRIIPSQYYF